MTRKCRRGTLTRDVPLKECDWLDGNLKKGKIVYEYNGPSYGCRGLNNGVMVSDRPGRTPAYELPEDAIEWEA